MEKQEMNAGGLPAMSMLLAAMAAGGGGPSSPFDFTFPKDDNGFNSFGKRFIAYMTTECARLGIAAAAVAALEGPVDTYEDKFAAVRTVPDHSSADVTAKNAAKAVAITAVDQFITVYLRGNAVWTKEDEVKVGFGAIGNNTIRPAAVTHPIGAYVNIQPGRIKAKFHDEGTQRVAIAEGSDSVDIYIKFDNGDGTSTTWTENYSTAHPTLILPRNCCNKKGEAKSRWRNNNPNKGPWSDSVPVYCILMDDMNKAPVTP